MLRARLRVAGERGASLVEYALLLALIAVVCIAAVSFVGRSGSAKLKGAGEGIAGTAASRCFETEGDSEPWHWYIDEEGNSSGYIPGPC
jgi:Flp pilus assembly pilin Flp